MTLHEFCIDDITFTFKVDTYINGMKIHHIEKLSIIIKAEKMPQAVIEKAIYNDPERQTGKRMKVSIVPLKRWGFTYDTETGRYSINFDEVPLQSVVEYWLDDKRPKEGE